MFGEMYTMKKFFISLLSIIVLFASIFPLSIASANDLNTNTTFNLEEIVLSESIFLYDLGVELDSIDEFTYDGMPDYYQAEVTSRYRMAPLIFRIIVEGVKVTRTLYQAIKYAPKYPQGFKAVQNGTKHVTVNNKSLLNELRQIEAGTWKKVYKDGYDKNGNRVSVHYFQSKSGLVYDVKTKSGWSKF